jgi:formylglycine-generating enzyme required for sulfatase activity
MSQIPNDPTQQTSNIPAGYTQLNTLAIEFSSVLDRMLALKKEMSAFLVINPAVDYAGLVVRLEPALEQAAEFLLEVDFLPVQLQDNDVIKKFVVTASQRMGFRMTAALLPRLEEAKQEAQASHSTVNVALPPTVDAVASVASLSEAVSSNHNNSQGYFGGIWTAGPTADDVCGRYGDIAIKGVTQRFRWMPEGNFLMGSPINEPERSSNEEQHLVTFEKGFWIASTACTQELWQTVMGKNPAKFKSNLQNPVEQVSWNDAQLFMQRLNEWMPSMTFRLPSEAEWEYACRADTNTVFSFGNTITTQQANYDGRFAYNNGARGVFRQETVPVKTFAPNAWGLYQMHCNVWEWCEDAYDYYNNTPVDGTAWVLGDGGLRIVRGGSWNDYPSYLRCAFRNRNAPDFRYHDVGFRIVCAPALVLDDI